MQHNFLNSYMVFNCHIQQSFYAKIITIKDSPLGNCWLENTNRIYATIKIRCNGERQNTFIRIMEG
jgi:hypothetical protein